MQPKPRWGLTNVTNIYDTGDHEIISAPGSAQRLIIVSMTWTQAKDGGYFMARLKDGSGTIFSRFGIAGGSVLHRETQYALGPGESLRVEIDNNGSEIYGDCSYWIWTPGEPYPAGYQDVL